MVTVCKYIILFCICKIQLQVASTHARPERRHSAAFDAPSRGSAAARGAAARTAAPGEAEWAWRTADLPGSARAPRAAAMRTPRGGRPTRASPSRARASRRRMARTSSPTRRLSCAARHDLQWYGASAAACVRACLRRQSGRTAQQFAVWHCVHPLYPLWDSRAGRRFQQRCVELAQAEALWMAPWRL